MNPLLKRLAIVPIIAAIVVSGLVIADGSDASGTDGSLHTLTFAPNGAEGSRVSWSVLHENSVKLPTNLFARDGYVLTGWSTSSSGTGTFGSLTVSSDTVLYAQWEKPSGEVKTSVPTTAEVGKNYSYSYSEYPVKDSQWAIILEGLSGRSSNLKCECPSWMNVECSIGVGKWSINISGTPSAPGNYIVKVWPAKYSDWTYWWSINIPSASDKKVSVTFDANGGTGSWAVEPGPVGTSVVLPSSGFTKEGYTLAAFSTSERGTTVYYPLGSVYTYTGSNAVMAAYYVADQGIVVFDANGGIADSGTSAYIVQTNGIVTMPSGGVTKSGHVLIGWKLSSDPDGKLYPKGYAYRMGAVSGTVTMAAAWATSGTPLVSAAFDPNGGTGGTMASVPSGTDVAVPVVGYTLPGYELAGWSTESDGSGVFYELGSSVVVSENTKLYAVWNENIVTMHSVIFVLNGGTGSVPSQSVADGSVASKPSDPSLEFYAFIGWQRIGDKTLYDFSAPVTSDITLRAMWVKMFSVTVSGTEVTVTLSPAFSGKSATVFWGTAQSVTSDSASHSYTAGSSGTLKVSCDGYAASAHYSIAPSVPTEEENHSDSEKTSVFEQYWWVAVVVVLALLMLRRFI